MYVEFGDYFPTGGLEMTAGQLQSDLSAGGINGPTFADYGYLNDSDVLVFQSLATAYNAAGANYTGSLGNGISGLESAILAVVKQSYAAFDVNVQIAPKLGYSSSAAYLAGINSTLQSSETGSCWAFCTAIRDGVGVSIGEYFGLYGIASGLDIAGTNDHSDSALIFADTVLKYPDSLGISALGADGDTAFGDVISHEVGHCFGLEHTYDTAHRRTVVLANSDLMGYSYSFAQCGSFTRYPLYLDSSPTTAEIKYDRLADSGLLGVNTWHGAYVTGTGAHDTITITRVVGTDTARVTVRAYSDAAHGTTIDVPGADRTITGKDGTIYTVAGTLFSYTIDITNGIVIETGEGADWVYIDALLAKSITLRGMSGDDRLYIVGNNVIDGSYTPSATASSLITHSPNGFAADMLSGTVVAGGTTINFYDFTRDSLIEVEYVTTFVYNAPAAGVKLTTTRGVLGVNYDEVNGNYGSVNFATLDFIYVANFLISERNFNGNNTYTIDSNGLDRNNLSLLQRFGFRLGTGTATVAVQGYVFADLWIDDAGLSKTDTYLVGATTVTRNSGTAIPYYSTFYGNWFFGTVISGGSAADTFNIQTTMAAALELEGNGGNDTMNVTEVTTAGRSITILCGDPTTGQLGITGLTGTIDGTVVTSLIENVKYGGDALNNDVITVRGTVGSEKIFVTPTGLYSATVSVVTTTSPTSLFPNFTFSGLNTSSGLRINGDAPLSLNAGRDILVYVPYGTGTGSFSSSQILQSGAITVNYFNMEKLRSNTTVWAMNLVVPSSYPMYQSAACSVVFLYPQDDDHVFSYAWYWGSAAEGTSSGTATQSMGICSNSITHSYSTAGTYTVTLTLTNNTTNAKTVFTRTIVVQPYGIIPDPTDATQTDFVVYGTNGNDTILISQGAVAGSVQVAMNGKILTTIAGVKYFTPTWRVIAYGMAGNDTITVNSNVTKTCILFGGNDNDSLTGGGGKSILVGGYGADTIRGGTGANILVGCHMLYGQGPSYFYELSPAFTNWEKASTNAARDGILKVSTKVFSNYLNDDLVVDTIYGSDTGNFYYANQSTDPKKRDKLMNYNKAKTTRDYLYLRQ